MIPHPELTIADILKGMFDGVETIKKVDGTETPEERVTAQEAMLRALQDVSKNVQVACTACGQAVPMLQSTPCTCGGFVCNPCRTLEGDTSCEHEPPDVPDGVE